MRHLNKIIKIALAGNPNCGKTTLFNQLTGSNQYVGNWPGVTIQKKSGYVKSSTNDIELIDLPGIYSLSPYSQEEIVSRNCILNESPDLILNIIDATNIERNLYLTTQLIELDCPIIVAVNMIDIIKKHGDILNFKLLEEKLHVPVVPISASKGTGLDDLVSKMNVEARNMIRPFKPLIYSPDLENILQKIEKLLPQNDLMNASNKRFYSVKIFENDSIVMSKLKLKSKDIIKIDNYSKSIQTGLGMDKEMIIADQRYKYICKLCTLAIKKGRRDTFTISDRIDMVATNKYLSIPIFILVLLTMFFVTFGPLGNTVRDGTFFLINDIVGGSICSLITMWGAPNWIISLIEKGIIAGVGSVFSFLPQIAILFTFLSILEDSGYMARGAFITDHFLRKVGLSGKAFVPLLMGFGCTVPAVMGTRILETNRDRRLAIIMTPFMSCSAKMPVYALFISTFFKSFQPLIILSIYLIGIAIGIFSTLFFKKSILKGRPPSFVMEMPPYHFPKIKNLSLHVWDRIKDFITKAGTVLLSATIIIWFLQSFNTNFRMVSDSSQSILAMIGMSIAPIFKLCGFGNWESSVSLLTGIIAKESIISTIAVLHGGSLSLSSGLTNIYTPLSAYSFMIFVLLYTPCIAAISAISKELKSVKWTFMIIGYQLFIAWLFSAMIFQFGTLFNNIGFIIAALSVIIILVILKLLYKLFKSNESMSRSNRSKRKGHDQTINSTKSKHKRGI